MGVLKRDIQYDDSNNVVNLTDYKNGHEYVYDYLYDKYGNLSSYTISEDGDCIYAEYNYFVLLNEYLKNPEDYEGKVAVALATR